MDFGSLFGGIGSFLGGAASASGLKAQAKYYTKAAQVSELSGKIKTNQIQRGIYQQAGQNIAAAGANNMALGGSAADVIRMNRQQGYLDRAQNTMNWNLEKQSYLAQAKAAKAAAGAAMGGGILGLAGGIMGMFSDDRLKENKVLLGRREDGIGIYQWNYLGSKTIYRGVMAHEVDAIMPEAINIYEGFAAVNYDMVGIKFEAIAHA